MINIPPTVAPVTDATSRLMPSWAKWVSDVYDVCFSITQSGTTAQRPTKMLWIGRRYFDTTLGYPIWYDGTNWVDATGATA